MYSVLVLWTSVLEHLWFLVVSAISCLERLVSEMTCHVWSGMLNPTYWQWCRSRGQSLGLEAPQKQKISLGLETESLRTLKTFASVIKMFVLIEWPLNLRGLIWLLMMVWSKRGNINTAVALVTIAQCNTLVARCSRQLIGPADGVFVTLGPLRCD